MTTTTQTQRLSDLSDLRALVRGDIIPVRFSDGRERKLIYWDSESRKRHVFLGVGEEGLLGYNISVRAVYVDKYGTLVQKQGSKINTMPIDEEDVSELAEELRILTGGERPR